MGTSGAWHLSSVRVSLNVSKNRRIHLLAFRGGMNGGRNRGQSPGRTRGIAFYSKSVKLSVDFWILPEHCGSKLPGGMSDFLVSQKGICGTEPRVVPYPNAQVAAVAMLSLETAQ